MTMPTDYACKMLILNVVHALLDSKQSNGVQILCPFVIQAKTNRVAVRIVFC